MSEFDEMIADLRQKRDELRVQINLASKEARDEWEELEDKMNEFTSKAKIGETGEGIGKALGELGHEIKLGYERMRAALKD
jgi:adenylosuccinate synthase